MMWLWIGLAGSAGAVARFVLDGVARSRFAPDFPWQTMVINISGSLLLGVVAGLVLFDGQPRELELVVGTGFCGGYTTFSTASFETVRLIQQGRRVLALAKIVGTVALTLGAAGLGLYLTSL